MANGQYHISKKGELVPCRAKIKCRLGGPHFDSRQEGQEYLDKKNEEAALQELREETLKTQSYTDLAYGIYEMGSKDPRIFNQDKDTQDTLKLWKKDEEKYEKDKFHNTVVENVLKGYISPESDFYNKWLYDRKYYKDFDVKEAFEKQGKSYKQFMLERLMKARKRVSNYR